EHRQETAVELMPRGVGPLQRRADQVRRDTLAAALELPLMEEPQARRQKRDDGRGLVHARRESGRRPGLVVVFQEPGELALEVEPGQQVLTHGPRVPLAQAV